MPYDDGRPDYWFWSDHWNNRYCQWVLNWHIFFLLMWPDCLHGPGRCFCSPLRSAPQRPPMEYPTECSSWSKGHRPLGLPGWAFSQPDMTNAKALSWTYEVNHYHKRFILYFILCISISFFKNRCQQVSQNVLLTWHNKLEAVEQRHLTLIALLLKKAAATLQE